MCGVAQVECVWSCTGRMCAVVNVCLCAWACQLVQRARPSLLPGANIVVCGVSTWQWGGSSTLD